MDAKFTLSFDEKVIEKAKEFAASQQIGLSRLTEFLYAQLASGDFKSLDELPISDWVSMIADGHAEY